VRIADKQGHLLGVHVSRSCDKEIIFCKREPVTVLYQLGLGLEKIVRHENRQLVVPASVGRIIRGLFLGDYPFFWERFVRVFWHERPRVLRGKNYQLNSATLSIRFFQFSDRSRVTISWVSSLQFFGCGVRLTFFGRSELVLDLRFGHLVLLSARIQVLWVGWNWNLMRVDPWWIIEIDSPQFVVIQDVPPTPWKIIKFGSTWLWIIF
jgi:hypothetical protein